MASFSPRFNQYKSKIKLKVEERREFKQEKLIEHFFLLSQNRTNEDIKVQMVIAIQTIKKLEKIFGFSIGTLCNPKGLNQKCALKLQPGIKGLIS